MRRFSCILLLSLLAMSADAMPPEFSAGWDIQRYGINIGRMTWHSQAEGGNTYRFKSVTSATGILALAHGGERREQTQWKLQAGMVRPLSYRYVDTERDRKNLAVAFDWQAMQARIDYRGRTRHQALSTGIQDRLSYILALGLDLKHQRLATRYTLCGKKGLKHYPVSRAGTGTVDTPLGKFDTIRITREGKRITTIWYAPALDYFPVQIEHREPDEKPVRFLLTTYSAGPGTQAISIRDTRR